MRNPRRLLVTTLAALALAGAGACTDGGSAPGFPSPSGSREPAGGGQEPAKGGQEPGTTGVEPTGGGYEQPGAGSAASCLACATYDCEVSIGGETSQAELTLSTGQNGACITQSSGQSLVLSCGGVIRGGGSTGSWQSLPGGGFSATFGNIYVTCAPAVSISGGSSSGGGGGPPVPGFDAG